MNAEKAVIGCLLIDINSIEKVYLNLTEEKFSDPYLGRIYHEIKKSYDNNLGADINTLIFQLGDLPEEIIQPLLVECAESVSTSIKIEQYASIVQKNYKARMLGRILNVNANGEDIDKTIEDLQNQLEILASDKVETQKDAKQLVNEYASQRGIPTRSQGINIGFKKIDDLIGGIDDGDIAIIGARPAVGKTAFLLEIMRYMVSQGKKTELFSLEMTNEQIYDRLVCRESGIDLTRVRRALKFNDSEQVRFETANEKLRQTADKMIFHDDVYTVSEMSLEIKKNMPDVVLIDYAQLIKSESNYKGNRFAEVGDVSRSLKKLAKRMKIPIFLLCQLNRVKDETKEPSMTELRESGDFEQDASVIILMWNKTEDKTEKGVKVDKNRSGKTGNTTLYFDGSKMIFSEDGNFDTHFEDAKEDTPFT